MNLPECAKPLAVDRRRPSESSHLDETRLWEQISSIIKSSPTDLSPGDVAERLAPANAEEEEIIRSLLIAMLAEGVIQMTPGRKLHWDSNIEQRLCEESSTTSSDCKATNRVKAAAATR
jgi:hypothetical protein